MNGASIELCAATRTSPMSSMRTSNGNIHKRFRCLRKSQISRINPMLGTRAGRPSRVISINSPSYMDTAARQRA